MRKGFCITSEETGDNFVGIRFKDGNPEVIFPRGYNIPDDEKERRKDVFRLLGVLQRFTEHREGYRPNGTAEIVSTLPIASYQYVIQDFLSHGYYIEKETEYIEAKKGKINWKKTIQKEDPFLDKSGVIYLDYQVKHNRINDNSLITQIHKYCVYESFRVFGWLYLDNDYLPPKPQIKPNRRQFTSVLKKELSHTNNDSKKRLFTSMLRIVNVEHEDISYHNSAIGVNHFAGVWERLVNYVFGEDNIEKYFPRAQWHILENGVFRTSTALEPDTIMRINNKIYILDAKYYQYGVTWAEGDLPNTSSIQKQITYGQHVESMNEVPKENIFNAFIMPFNSAEHGENGDYILRFVAVGSGGWETYEKPEDIPNYSYILGILLDTRHIVTSFSRHNSREIEKLADKIEESIAEYKQKMAEMQPSGN